jgi:predicted amidohydrolase
MRRVTLAICQMESVVGDVGRNGERVLGFLEDAAGAGADLACFPEGCLTGYSAARAGEIAIGADDARAAAIESSVAELDVAVSYGYIERAADGTLFVTHVVTDGHERLVYRKSNLGPREREVFAAGDSIEVACIAGVNVGVHLCWESHFPQISTELRARGAELILVPYAGPTPAERRCELWSRYLPARAYDNGAFVVACNALRVDEAGSIRGGGMCAYGPTGELICDYRGDDEHMLLCEIGGPLPRETPNDTMGHISFVDFA